MGRKPRYFFRDGPGCIGPGSWGKVNLCKPGCLGEALTGVLGVGVEFPTHLKKYAQSSNWVKIFPRNDGNFFAKKTYPTIFWGSFQTQRFPNTRRRFPSKQTNKTSEGRMVFVCSFYCARTNCWRSKKSGK